MRAGIVVPMHTGCSCRYCHVGKDSRTRREFIRKLRRSYKRELKQNGDITNINLSIG